jgi:hypothetical protein
VSTLQKDRIDLSEILNKADTSFVSTEDSLSDVERIKWGSDVINGTKKVTLVSAGAESDYHVRS